MDTDKKNIEKNTTTTTPNPVPPAKPGFSPQAPRGRGPFRGAGGGGAIGSQGRMGRRGGGAGRGPRRRDEGGRERSEFGQKVIDVRRVARVVAGGRRFNFSVAIILGDKNGRVGVGLGKAQDTSLAIDKATRDAKKHMIKIPLTTTKSISHEVEAKYSSTLLRIIPVPGKGLVAGSSVRNVLALAGVTDVTAKIQSRSKNKLNNARAAVEALKTLKGISLV